MKSCAYNHIQLKDHIYALTPKDSLYLGKRSQGHITNYYPGTFVITDEEVAAVQTAAEALNIDVLNTRSVPLSMSDYMYIEIRHCCRSGS
jgi:dipeptidyl-peptidase III